MMDKRSRSLAIAAMAVLGISGMGSTIELTPEKPRQPDVAPNASRSNRGRGVNYPHSSKRQRDRYARQIEAGQCNLDPVQSK